MTKQIHEFMKDNLCEQHNILTALFWNVWKGIANNCSSFKAADHPQWYSYLTEGVLLLQTNLLKHRKSGLGTSQWERVDICN